MRHKGLLTAAVMLAMTMQVLDTTIANVALPHMQATLGATQENISWVLTSYIIAVAVAIPLTGWLSSRIGMRRLLIGAVTLFVVASALCGVAADLPSMVAFRLLQGIGGAFIGPLAQTIMLDINKPSDHPRAMSLYGMGVLIGPIVGPVLGGWLTDSFDWRWVFYINVPLGVICLGLLWVLMPKARNAGRPFDLFGWLMLAIALAAFQLALDRGAHVDWFAATEIWIESGIALSALWIFLIHSATARKPLIPMPVLRNATFMASMLMIFIMGLVLMSSLALLPLMLQGLFGYPVMLTGEILASRGIGMMLTIAITGRVLKLVDARLLVLVGFLIIAFSLHMMTGWTLEMDWRPVVTSGLVQGMGIGFVFVPLNILAFSALPAEYRTDAASLFNLARNLGSSVGVALVSALLARNIQVSHADLAAHVTPYTLPMDPTLLQAMGVSGTGALAMMDDIINRQASMIAYLDDFHLVMLSTICVLPLLLLLRKPPKQAGAPPPLSE